MSVSIKGDLKALKAMQEQLSELSERKMLGLSRVLRATAVDLVFEGFEKQVAPDGTPWLPLKKQRSRQGKREGSDKILQDSSRLRNSMTSQQPAATSKGFRIGTNVEYAAHHQFGTQGRKKPATRVQAVNKRGKFMKHSQAAKQKRGAVAFRILNFQAGGGKIPARPMLPEGELPERWAKPLERAARKFLKEALEPKK